MQPKLKKALIPAGILFNSFLLGWPIMVHAQNPSHGVAAASIQVIQHDAGNTTNSVTVSTSLSINQFHMRPGSNKGDYNVQIGPNANDDMSGGIIITCVAQNGRDNVEASHPGINYGTSAINYHRSGSSMGAYYVPVFNAPAGAEFNFNVAAGYFPYNKWLGGYAYNSNGTSGGPNNQLTASPGLSLGTHFIDNGDGISTVNLTSLGIHSQTDGVLLVTHGGNEDNYALSRANTDGTWTVYIKDSGTDANTPYEQDPVAFVYIPRTNTTVVSGRFLGNGTRLISSGATPQYNVVNTSSGNWRLTIPGHSPTSGVLIISAEGGLSYNQDNIVSYRPDGDAWIIQSRDLPGTGLQTPNNGVEPVVSFVFIPAPSVAAVTGPANDAQNQSSGPTLQVAVSNTIPGNVTVNFYGREGKPKPEDFAIALLPDTQYYVSSRNGGIPAMFYAQTEWIITNRVSENIVYVAHLGDLTQSGDLVGSSPNTTEWRNATNAMYRLENPLRTLLPFGIPYGVAVGNHDQEPIGAADGTTTFYNQYFGISHFAGRPYYAGHYSTNNDNHFDFFSAGGMDFIVLYFEFDTNANPAVLEWGNEVLRTNSHRRAIVVTHNLGNTQTPVKFSAQGTAIYNALKGNTNLFMMLSGHVTGEGSRVDTHNGHTIRTYVQDYQGWTNGGNGFMRVMYFSPTNNEVVVQSFSPWTGEYETDANSEFFFGYNMQLPADPNQPPFAYIGSVTNVASGSQASLPWKGRAYDAHYEWYVSITDAFGNTAVSPVWAFKTGVNVKPVVSNKLVQVIGDLPTNLTLVAFDENGDELIYRTNSQPLNGLILNFDATEGTFTYMPAHGYRGFNSFTYDVSDGSSTSSIANFGLHVISPADTNSNGIPDTWEAAYGLSDADEDADGDGQTNLQEYFANTNPTNATSFLKITFVNGDNTGPVTLAWPSIGGTRYRVQISDSDATGSFTGIFYDIVRPVHLEMDPAPKNATSMRSFVDDFTLTGSPPPHGTRYYRIRVIQ